MRPMPQILRGEKLALIDENKNTDKEVHIYALPLHLLGILGCGNMNAKLARHWSRAQFLDEISVARIRIDW